jgi:hypothetical protein
LLNPDRLLKQTHILGRSLGVVRHRLAVTLKVRGLDVARLIVCRQRVTDLVRRFPFLRGWIDAPLAKAAREP